MLVLASRLDMAAYQVRTTLELPIELNVQALERALQSVVNRHEALRASFPGDDGDEQQIRDKMKVDLKLIDLTALPENMKEQEVSKLFDRDSRNPLNLEQGPIFRFTLLRLERTRHLLVMAVHHAVYDGIAEQVLMTDIAHFYNTEIGRTTGSTEEAASYVEVVQRSLKEESDGGVRNLEFWNRLLTNCPALQLPVDKTPPIAKTTSGGRLRMTIEASVRNKLRRIAAENLTTPYILFLAAYAVFLHELCNQDDLLIGISLTNRHRDQHGTLIANCSNMIPIRSVLSGDGRFVDHLRTIRNCFLEMQEHAEIPFARLVEKFGKENWSAPPLVSTCFNWDHTEPPVFAGVQAKLRPDPATAVRFPLSLNIADSSGEWNLEWDFNTDLFNERSIALFASRFSTLLASICQRDGEELLKRADASPVGLVRDQILRQCRQKGQSIAVIDDHTTLSYELLERQSASLSLRLRGLGVKKGDVVAFRLPTSSLSIVAILAIWRAGAAFAPIDYSAPVAWIEKLLGEIRPKAIVAVDSDLLPKSEAPVLLMDGEAAATLSASTEDVALDGKDVGYVICTSGTTGTPKCVAISHDNLISYVDAINERLNWDVGGDFLLVSPLHVDLGYTVIFPALAGGGALHVASDSTVRTPVELIKFLRRSSVDYLKITPTHLAALLEHEEAKAMLPQKMVVLGGEPLPWDLVDRLWRLAPDLSIFNHYGPAETTIGVLTYRVQKEDPSRTCTTVPIGFPLRHVQVDVIGSDGNPVPEGVEGEIVVTGRGVASGYLLRDGTLLPFGDNLPHAALRFRTDDIAHRKSDGAIVFRHRRGELIKVRGFRVDLGEVRNTVVAHGCISDAQVVPNCDLTALTCWVVPQRAGQPFDTRLLTKYLEDQLPPAMRPSRIVVIDKLPMTKSGKVDRTLLQKWTCCGENRSLRLQRAAATAQAQRMPASEAAVLTPETPHNFDRKIEPMLALWGEVLTCDDLRQDQSFFELGGDSISAIKLIGRIRRKYGVDVSIRNLFDYPTPGAILDLIQDLKASQRYVEST
jgi:amino acid adenylation domain-containing protein